MGWEASDRASVMFGSQEACRTLNTTKSLTCVKANNTSFPLVSMMSLCERTAHSAAEVEPYAEYS